MDGCERSGAGSTGAAAEHDTAAENSGLATIVRGNILLAVVHVDTRLAGTLPARHQEDVVPLPHGDPIGLLERGELQQVIM